MDSSEDVNLKGSGDDHFKMATESDLVLGDREQNGKKDIKKKTFLPSYYTYCQF